MKFSTLAFFAFLFPAVSNAQVAKFAAGWESKMESTMKVVGVMPDGKNFPEKLATIKSAQNKELLIGLSGVINLLTFTEAKGKAAADGEGVKVTSTADASVAVTVRYILSSEDSTNVCDEQAGGQKAYPGAVTFSSRKQELSVTNNLLVVNTTAIDDPLTVALAGSVDVALELDTTAAHHFNFLAVDLPSGTYDIYACWDLNAGGSLSGTDTDAGSFAAKAAIHKRMLTVEQVRAVKTDETLTLESGNVRRA